MDLGFVEPLKFQPGMRSSWIWQDSLRGDLGFDEPWRFDENHQRRTLGLMSLRDSTRLTEDGPWVWLALEIRLDSPRADLRFNEPWRFDDTHQGQSLGLMSLRDSTRDALFLGLLRLTYGGPLVWQALEIWPETRSSWVCRDSPREDLGFDEPLWSHYMH